MRSAELQPRANIERRAKESVAFLGIVLDGEILRTELQLRIGDLTVAVVLERELDLGEVVEELA